MKMTKQLTPQQKQALDEAERLLAEANQQVNLAAVAADSILNRTATR